MQRVGDHPSVAAIVARAGGHDDAGGEMIGEDVGEYPRGRRPCALHQRARGNPRGNGLGVARRCAGGVDDRDARRYFSDTPTVLP